MEISKKTKKSISTIILVFGTKSLQCIINNIKKNLNGDDRYLQPHASIFNRQQQKYLGVQLLGKVYLEETG